MAVTLMTTTGTQEDVNAALKLTQEANKATIEPNAVISASTETPPTTPATQTESPDKDEPSAVNEELPEAGEALDTTTPQQKAADTRGRFQKRIDELTAVRFRTEGERDAARREVQELRAELARLTRSPQSEVSSAPTQTPATESKEPKEADYDTYEAFIEARADYRARKAYREEREAERAEEAKRQQQTAQTQQRKLMEDRIKAFEADHPDYREVVNNPDLILTNALAYGLQMSEDGPALAYALAKDPARFKAIAALGPFETARALGELSAELRQAAPAKTEARPAAPPKQSAVPPPPTPVRGGSVATAVSLEEFAKTITPGDPKTSEWLRRRNEQLARQGQR